MRALLRRALRAAGVPLPRRAAGGRFGADEIDRLCETYRRHGSAPDSPWDAWRDAHMRLPEWFRTGLDPLGAEYAAQQHRLWQLVSGVARSYMVEVDEKEHDWSSADPIRTPGYFSRRDAQAIGAASDHVIATGMLLKHSGLKAADWALEYGAGFGQTALALARLGVNVDTVDVSTTFNDFIRRQADFFQVPLHAFEGRFGMNPRPGQRYQLIWFYESFHHCLDFQQVVLRLREHLADGGRVILGGEPIVERENDAVPYPWGLRLHSEVAAVVRMQHWFELGFSEDFLAELFTAAGFLGRRIECEPSLFGRLYVFERRPREVSLATCWLPTVVAQAWGDADAEADGRWALGESPLPVDAGGDFAALEADIVNPSSRPRRVRVTYGDAQRQLELGAGTRTTVRFDAVAGVRHLVFGCDGAKPGLVERLQRRHGTRRGMLVRRLRYVSS